MTDEERIAVAMLHGCGFYKHVGANRTTPSWYVDSAIGPLHPVEAAAFRYSNRCWFHTREELARAYCKFYNLER